MVNLVAQTIQKLVSREFSPPQLGQFKANTCLSIRVRGDFDVLYAGRCGRAWVNLELFRLR